MKYAIKISYLGKNYSGWQIQPDTNTIQLEIENVLKKITHEEIRITGAGRTDKGVNAVAQIASFRINKDWENDKLLLALNFHLPDDIRIIEVKKVNEDFNARYSAKSREYRYFIYEGRACPPYLSEYVWWKKNKFWNMDLARKACKLLEGEHNFRAFCRREECPENPIRTLEKVNLHKIKLNKTGNIIILRVKGKSFLTNMIRIIAGNINEVATENQNLEWFSELLNGKERTESAMTAPAQGLWFWSAYY